MDIALNTISTEIDSHGILIATLNRPDKLNALNTELLQELQQLVDYTKKTKEVKALLLTGAGKAFCAGADIQELAEIMGSQGFQFARNGQRILRALEQLAKPVLAAINGYTFGGGCELAMSCHLRIATENAKFGQPEVKLGVIPGYGGTQRLARLIGKGRAIELCVTGRSIDAECAMDWGLISQVCPQDELMRSAKDLLQNILAMGPQAVASIFNVIDQGYNMNLDEALQLEASQFGLCCATKDKHEGVNAFLEKRTANFTGE